ncbi:hypothetical protein N7462_004119 [Penicillium macrosclerotiorum]|uniref:uncharacterized protein n=1 Tax=Penicillium macrosclerotiorum TaxID=303699 RepID=UPI002548AFFE|nr:uncharacterized protein N7462_004119 [Penicillium macrosclerotiorum]KAJ5689727.1 hypothetical protein N7462_004119 [Penicillium macrosclerotiorum]
MPRLPCLGLFWLAWGFITRIEATGDLSSLNDSVFRRNEQNASWMADRSVQGVRKMSDDEGEKFFLEYWQFGGEAQTSLPERGLAGENTTVEEVQSEFSPDFFLARSYSFRPSHEPKIGDRSDLLQSRDFKCPTGMTACTSIHRSDRCCNTGDTCELVEDTGLGSVGCCPKGKTCSGTIGSCQSEYTACSQALGGGCCIPGYDCVEGGCAYISVVTVTIDSTVTISTITHSTSQQTTQSTSSHSSTKISSSDTSTHTTSGESLTPADRGTTLTTSTHTTTSRVYVCPTGFYACSAVYNGGCCQTGRNCDTTSCPVTSSTTFTSDGRTIVVPVSTGTSNRTGKCASGWFKCSDTAGGGCCPSGFACGSSCTATAATSTVAKEQPTSNEAELIRVDGLLGIGLLCAWWLSGDVHIWSP